MLVDYCRGGGGGGEASKQPASQRASERDAVACRQRRCSSCAVDVSVVNRAERDGCGQDGGGGVG